MLITTFSLLHDAVALERTVQELPELEVEAERIAAHSRAWVMACQGTANAEFAAADDEIASEPSVDTVVDADEFADETYYQLDLTDEVAISSVHLERRSSSGRSIPTATAPPEQTIFATGLDNGVAVLLRRRMSTGLLSARDAGLGNSRA